MTLDRTPSGGRRRERGRHVGWGDGVYESLDGGQSLRRMWLERSEHIGDVVVDPRDSDVVYAEEEDAFLHVTDDGGASFEILGTGRESTATTTPW